MLSKQNSHIKLNIKLIYSIERQKNWKRKKKLYIYINYYYGLSELFLFPGILMYNQMCEMTRNGLSFYTVMS